MERTLYNGLISGVSLDGKLFFYPNPLESDGRHQRSPWFGCACCPGNITRFMASVPGYVYAQQGDVLYVNLYAGGTADVKMDDGRTIKITQETRYPWDGAVKMKLDPDKPGEFTVNVRIPGWARDEAVPSDLYKFMDKANEPVTIKVNGRNVPIALDKGYVSLKRAWNSGDVIELNLPMPVRRVLANDKVADDAGKVALQRGPLVYCIEWPDVKDGQCGQPPAPGRCRHISRVPRGPARRGGSFKRRGPEPAMDRGPQNREGQSRVHRHSLLCLGESRAAARWPCGWPAWSRPPGPCPIRPSPPQSKATASGRNMDVKALNDQHEPKTSGDHSNRYLHWWPSKGTKQWVQYDFAKPARVSAVEVYWFDDTGVGECRLPKSWQLFYREKDQWKPVANPSGYGCRMDRYNRTTFDPVETDAPAPGSPASAGFFLGDSRVASGVNQMHAKNLKRNLHCGPAVIAVLVCGWLAIHVLSAYSIARDAPRWDDGKSVDAKSKQCEQTGPEDKIVAIDPPEKDFFSKLLEYEGIPIKAPKEVADEALFAAKARLSMMLGNLPEVRSRLHRAGAELHIIGRDQVTTDLPEWRRDKGKPLAEYNGLTRDQRTRGMGGWLTSCGEENLLKLENDRYKGRDICVHEFAHNIFQ